MLKAVQSKKRIDQLPDLKLKGRFAHNRNVSQSPDAEIKDKRTMETEYDSLNPLNPPISNVNMKKTLFG